MGASASNDEAVLYCELVLSMGRVDVNTKMFWIGLIAKVP
jgi:hypothetical protein